MAQMKWISLSNSTIIFLIHSSKGTFHCTKMFIISPSEIKLKYGLSLQFNFGNVISYFWRINYKLWHAPIYHLPHSPLHWSSLVNTKNKALNHRVWNIHVFIFYCALWWHQIDFTQLSYHIIIYQAISTLCHICFLTHITPCQCSLSFPSIWTIISCKPRIYQPFRVTIHEYKKLT